MRKIFVIVPIVIVGLMGSGCASEPGKGAPGAIGTTSPTVSRAPATGRPATRTPKPTRTPTATVTKTATTAQWPSPEDCVSYDPTHLTTHYEAGIFTVLDGAKEVARLQGDPGSDVGEQGKALAERYRKHCFLGRGNTLPDAGQYSFDYWRSPTGAHTTIPGEDDACSPYDPTNLTLEDLGSGGGWRLKDHDHVLHLFDSDSDGKNGMLVASKYHEICFLGVTTDSDLDQISYFR